MIFFRFSDEDGGDLTGLLNELPKPGDECCISGDSAKSYTVWLLSFINAENARGAF